MAAQLRAAQPTAHSAVRRGAVRYGASARSRGRRGRGNKHRVMYDAPETQAQAQPSQKSVFSRLGLANGGGELAPTACDGSSE